MIGPMWHEGREAGDDRERERRGHAERPQADAAQDADQRHVDQLAEEPAPHGVGRGVEGVAHARLVLAREEQHDAAPVEFGLRAEIHGTEEEDHHPGRDVEPGEREVAEVAWPCSSARSAAAAPGSSSASALICALTCAPKM